MAMTLADIRAKYPQYAGVDDQKLADAIYNKYYAGKDRREYDARVGLKPYDSLLTGVAKGVQNIVPGMEQSLAGMSQMAGEFLTDAATGEPQPPSITGNLLHDLGNVVNAPTDLARAAIGLLPEETRKGLAREGAMQSLRGQLHAQAAEKNMAQVDAPTLSAPAIAATTVTSTAQMIPAIAASILLRNPTPALAAAGVQSGGQAYRQGREDQIDWEKGFFDEANKAGLQPEQARQYAGLYAAAEAIPEMLPLGVLLKEGTKAVTRVAQSVVTEAASEGITQALQSALDKGYVKPDMTWGEAWPQIVHAMAAGAIGGGVFGVGAQVLHGASATPETPPPVAPGELPVVPPSDPIEDRLALPSPGVPLALPSPDAFKAPEMARRQPAAPMRESEQTSPTVDELDYQARVALQRSRQKETQALLDTARETITPLGSFSPAEIGEDAAGRVRQRRIQMGKPVEAPVTIAELAAAKVPQRQIDAIIAARRPVTAEAPLTALDVTRAAAAKNIIADDGNFGELALRTTGQKNLRRMTQAQLNALKTTIDAMPAHDAPVTVPIAEQPGFTEDHYGKALDAIRKDGRYSAQAIKDATGLKDATDVRAIRDAMVRRGQLVQHSPADFRLYDVVGKERQAVPDDLPPGAFKEHVVRRLPVGQIRIRHNGKSLGTFGSGTEARNKVREVRAAEAEQGLQQGPIALEQAEDVAWGVMENRYDEQGNLLGQVVVDTHRNEDDAQRSAERLNNPDTGARYTQTAVQNVQSVQGSENVPARRVVPPAALEGRVPEILKRLNQLAKDRKLPLLGVRVSLQSRIEDPEAGGVEGLYFKKLISLSAESLTPNMSTDQIVDSLAQVMDHELVHALRATGVLSPETTGWKTLARYVRRARRGDTRETFMEFARRHYSQIEGYTADMIEEEAIAEAFRAWAANRRAVVGQPATVFRQIVEWFKRLTSAVPEDLFRAIESGSLVEDALRPPGSNLPRARATRQMEQSAAEASAAQAAQDENLVRVKSREFLRARAQAREDRYGRSGPKTVIGTTPNRAYETGDVAMPPALEAAVASYREKNGIGGAPLRVYLPEDVHYLARVADAQQKGVHAPKADAVAKAYRALVTETKAMFQALGDLEVEAWIGDGQPYASPAEMLADIAAGHLRMRLSNGLFGPGADNPGHPMNDASGVKTVDGQDLSNNDLFRVVHDVYGHGQAGFRDNPRGAYNAYHEHARLLSPEARRALATETLAQRAWQDYGPHLRRSDGSVPRETDIDYLPPGKKEFAEQKAFVLPEDLVAADPGWALAAKVDGLTETPRFMVGWHGTPHKVDKFSSEKIGTGEGAQAFGHGLYFAGRKEVAQYYQNTLAAGLAFKKNGAGPKLKMSDAVSAVVEEIASLVDLEKHPEDFDLPAFLADDALSAVGGGRSLYDLRKQLVGRFPEKEVLINAAIEAAAKFNPTEPGNLYKVDIPDDSELMNWDAPLSKQPPHVKEAILKIPGAREALGKLAAEDDQLLRDLGETVPEGGAGQWPAMSGEEFYKRLAAETAVRRMEGHRPDLPIEAEAAASQLLREAGIPGHRYLEGASRSKPAAIASMKRDLAAWEGRLKDTPDDAYVKQEVEARRQELADAEAGIAHNYVIYDDSRIQILEENPKFSKFADNLPGGRLYGNPNRSPGGALSRPETPTASFSEERPGNRFFGGELAEEQLRMAREGERGATMIYISPADFLTLAGDAQNPEQEVYDSAVAAGYKLSTLPSIVTDGYAGNVRVSETDGVAGVRALQTSDAIPVVIYPKKGELGLVTALEGRNGTVKWPNDGRAENFIEERGETPKYSLNSPFGTRVPQEDVNGVPENDQFNIVHQRVEGWMGRTLHNLGRGKKEIPLIGGALDRLIGAGTPFDIRVVLQDSQLSVKETLEELRKAGGEVPNDSNPYVLQQAVGSRAFHGIEEREAELYVPLFEAIRAAGKPARGSNMFVTPKDVELYLYARHAPERNAVLRAKGSKAPNPSGMSDAEAGSVMDQFALDGKLPSLETVAREFDKITANTTRTRLEGGTISPEMAASNLYQHYAPMRDGEDSDPFEEKAGGPKRARSGRGLAVSGREDRPTVGRGSKAGDLIGNAILQNTEAVIRAEKNRVGNALLDIVNANPELAAPTIKVMQTAPTKQTVDSSGMIRTIADPAYRQQTDKYFVTKVKGKEVVLEIADPRLARALNSDYVDKLGPIMQMINRVMRFIAAVRTSRNPSFLITNFARDFGSAVSNSSQYDVPNMALKVAQGTLAAGKGIAEVEFKGTASSPMALAYKEMQANGWTIEFMGLHDLESIIRKAQLDAGSTSGLKLTARQVRNRIENILKVWDSANNVVENSLRVSAYKAARDAGASITEAGYLAKNLTVNFNKGGEKKALVNTMYLFYNASAQAGVVTLNLLKNKRGQKIVAGLVVFGFLADLLNRAMSGDDNDNDIKDYDEVNDYTAEHNLIIPNPLRLADPKAPPYLKWPLPLGLNVFFNAGRNLSNMLSGSPAHPPLKSLLNIATATLDSFNPVGGGNNFLNFVAPTFMDPFIEVLRNKDYADRPIKPEQPGFGVPVPDSQLFWNNTDQAFVGTAAMLNSLTGGNEVRKGAADVSPEILEYTFDYLLGGTGQFAMDLAYTGTEAMPRALSGNFDTIEPNRIPFVKAIVGTDSNRANAEQFYNIRDEVRTVEAELKLFAEQGDRLRYQARLASSPVEARMVDYTKKVQDALSALRKQIEAVREAPNLDATKKRTTIDDLKKRQNTIMAQYVKTYYGLKTAK